jgi:predicted enzyme related to lactoylglutathione lyase
MKAESGTISVRNATCCNLFTRNPTARVLLVTAMIAVTILSGCGTFQRAQLPPIPSTSDAETNTGQFVWIDLLTEDTGVASVFYEALFGWRTAPSKGNKAYYVFSHDGTRIAGMTAVDNKDGEVVESWWLLSLSVDDVDQSVAVAQERGGKLLEGPVDDAGRGRMALVSDPGGAPLILLHAVGGEPGDEKAAYGTWVWTDLFTRDAKAAERFYSPLIGIQKKQLDTGKGNRYSVFIRDGKAHAGLVELRWDELRDNWLPYVKVEDVKSTINRALELGGNLIVQKGDVAILVDPTGAVFGVQAGPNP